MFAMIFRGVFLVAVLALYSTGVWKMIDGFFKDRFQNYLHEELRKNPKMRDDLNAAYADKRESEFANSMNLPSAPKTSQRPTSESPASGRGSVDALATAAAASFSENVDHGTSESRENTVTASVDNNAFRESRGMQAKRNARPMRTTGSHGSREQSSLVHQKEGEKKGKKIGEKVGKQGRDVSGHDSWDVGENGERRDKGKMRDQREAGERREKKEKRSIVESGSNGRESKKRKYSPITFTEDDFKSAKRSVADDDDTDDFAEFDLNDEMKIEPRREGILVSELPFKPRFDIGDLEIVTADEFCPLTLEDEATCGVTSKWP